MNRSPGIHYLLLAASILLFSGSLISFHDEAHMTTDTVHYMSVARNLLRGHGLKTDLIYYEEHYRSESIPAPQTVWPPAFSLLTAAGAALGLSFERAAFFVALIGFGLAPIVLFRLARQADCTPNVALWVSLLWLSSGLSWSYVTSILTESTYILFTLLSMTLFVDALRGGQRDVPLMAASGLSAAAAFMTRYLGVFFMASLGLFLLWQAFRSRDRRSVTQLLSFGLAPLLCLCWTVVRNYEVTGSLSSSPGVRTAGRGWIDVLRDLYWTSGKTLGFHPDDAISIVLQVGFLSFLVLLLFGLWRRASMIQRRLARPAVRQIAVCASLYVAITLLVLSALSLNRIENFVNERFLLPLLPFALLLTAMATRSAFGRPLAWGVVATIIFAVGQARVLAVHVESYRPDGLYGELRTALALDWGDRTVAEVLRARSGSSRPLLAENGQLLGWILDRPVVGTTAPLFTDRVWTTEEVLRLIRRYNVGYVVLFPNYFLTDTIWTANEPFLTDLHRGIVPDWLVQVYDDPRIRIFEVQVEQNGLTAQTASRRWKRELNRRPWRFFCGIRPAACASPERRWQRGPNRDRDTSA